ncbi:uncharacterized protein IL334_003320 [Kwoniella shivajii]|uniref:Uncharacterized protein n=1 Tax=Kwoniella shivajii TaxID=564305 RepID=A0ABZ1CYW6_9TREE|nr:hypothetical protein IL334_003320 [Kwoniella shivajii]
METSSLDNSDPHPLFSSSSAKPLPLPLSDRSMVRARPEIRIGRAWPLALLGLFELVYTIHFLVQAHLPTRLILLSLIRISALGFISLSKSWRFKGSYIAILMGITIGNTIWELCSSILLSSDNENQNENGNENQNGEGGEMNGNKKYLIITSMLSIIEYLTHILLIRISPSTSQSTSTKIPLPHTLTPSSTKRRSVPHTRTPSSFSRRNTRNPVHTPRSVSVRFKDPQRVSSRDTTRSFRPSGQISDFILPDDNDNNNNSIKVKRDQSSIGDVFTSSAEVGASNDIHRRSIDHLWNDEEDHINGRGYAIDDYEDDDDDYYDEEDVDHGNYEEDLDNINQFERSHAFDTHHPINRYFQSPSYDSIPRPRIEGFQMDDIEVEDEDDENDENEEDVENDEDDDNDDDNDDDDDDDNDDSSSISSSSIIDLPPPLSPSIIPLPIPLARSTSLNILPLHRGISHLTSSPIVEPLVRRSRSARFLSKSWASSSSWLNQEENRQEEENVSIEEDGYGTFV